MTELLEYIVDRRHRAFRKPFDRDLAAEFSVLGLSPEERMTRRFELLCAAQTPVFLPGEKICFLRTATGVPDVFTKEEWEKIRSEHFIHESGYLSNLSPDYERVIASGLEALKGTKGENSVYSDRAIDALLSLTDRYRAAAEEKGDHELAEVLRRVPRYGARTLREALQSFRILHFGMWLEGNYHCTVGRFDRYMWKYYASDLAAGRLDEQSAYELIEDFFLSFNKDSDLYPGVQQGDNGQSMMLGGTDPFEADTLPLIRLCLRASKEIKMIDPKINLRVGKDTPLSLYELGSELTKEGLGFPQYSNDDVVIPGLEALGYSHEDASDYTVAACWEFIIPRVGGDVANIAALSFPKVIDRAMRAYLPECAAKGDFPGFLSGVRKELFSQLDAIIAPIRDLWFVPSPFLSLLMDCDDISKGAKYNNFGMHGTGAATAADALCAIKKYVFDDRSVSAERMIAACDSDFAGEDELLHRLRYETPKIGQGSDEADGLLRTLLEDFSDGLSGRTNCRGGVWRAGTGTAMFYLRHADELPASPDGRRKGEPFGTNFSPSLFARTDGPFSVIRSMTCPDLSRCINGGPVTFEFAASMFADPECVGKIAGLVRAFVLEGGHQVQLNVISADALRDAQLHPDNYRRLIVRIWGWSAYFVELDREYQDHVLARQEYSL